MLKILSVSFLISFLMTNLLFGHDYKLGNLIIDHPLVKKSQQNARGYLVITNKGSQDIFLINGKSFFSKDLQLHKDLNLNEGKMEIVERIKIPAGSKVSLKDINYHLMFYDYDKNLNWFDRHKAKLIFSNNKEIEIEFDIDE